MAMPGPKQRCQQAIPKFQTVETVLKRRRSSRQEKEVFVQKSELLIRPLRAKLFCIDQSIPTIPFTSLNPGYNPAFAAWNVVTVKQSVANMALSVLADAVLRVATRLKAPVIDLRRVMNKARWAETIGDYAVGLLLFSRVIVLCCNHLQSFI